MTAANLYDYFARLYDHMYDLYDLMLTVSVGLRSDTTRLLIAPRHTRLRILGGGSQGGAGVCVSAFTNGGRGFLVWFCSVFLYVAPLCASGMHRLTSVSFA
jgi:hypothetical protein